jgi:hypothetical protein
LPLEVMVVPGFANNVSITAGSFNVIGVRFWCIMKVRKYSDWENWFFFAADPFSFFIKSFITRFIVCGHAPYAASDL